MSARLQSIPGRRLVNQKLGGSIALLRVVSQTPPARVKRDARAARCTCCHAADSSPMQAPYIRFLIKSLSQSGIFRRQTMQSRPECLSSSFRPLAIALAWWRRSPEISHFHKDIEPILQATCRPAIDPVGGTVPLPDLRAVAPSRPDRVQDRLRIGRPMPPGNQRCRHTGLQR